MRHRQMAHGFSAASLTKMEYIFDRHASIMMKKLDRIAESGEPIDLIEIFKFYTQDTNGELSFSMQYHLQEKGDISLWPPMNLYITMAKICGYVPGLLGPVVKFGPYIPYLRGLLKSRSGLIQDAIRNSQVEYEKRRVKHAEATFDDDDNTRINLLTSLVMAKDPETGEMLDLVDIAEEAMSFVVAGSHSTSASMSFLFAALIQHPEILRKVQEEIDTETPLEEIVTHYDGESLPAWAGLQTNLPYLSAVLKESFRLYQL
jgi:benzoate 4-monooxygenase